MRILLLILFVSLTNILAGQKRMMYGDTSQRGIPFSKDPHVIRFHDSYQMYYSIPPYSDTTIPIKGWGIGIASSPDGIHWTRFSDKPFLSNGEPGEWNSSESGHPHIFQDTDGRTYLFYQGNNDNGKTWFISKTEVKWNSKGPYLARDPD